MAPQLSGRPLVDSDADAALFVGRDAALDRLVAALDAGRNVAVHGEPGAGRTSLLRQLARRLRLAGTEPLWISGTELAGLDDLLARVTGHVGVRPRGDARDATAPAPAADALDALAAATAGASHRPVVIVDDIPAGLGNVLFGSWRDRLWAAGVTWVVSIRSGALADLLRGPASAFFETTVVLTPLDADAARDLVARRLGLGPAPLALDPATLDRIVETGGGNPRRLVTAAGDVVVGGADADVLGGFAAWRAERVEKLSAAASMLVRELSTNEWVSASDVELQQRLGWTRARLTQVFALLVQAGLVTSTTQRQAHGRPRRVFRPLQASEWKEDGS